VPGVRVVRPGQDFAQLDVEQSVDPETVLRAALDRGLRVTQFLIDDPSIEDIFIEKVGRRPTEEQHLADAAAAPTGATGGGATGGAAAARMGRPPSAGGPSAPRDSAASGSPPA
jgi:hypothetical protein